MASNDSSEGKIEERALLVTFTPAQPPGSEEKVRDKLQIHFQRRKHSGGDVDKVIYPLPGYPSKAIVVFSPESNADIGKLIGSKHVIDLGKDAEIDIVVEALPKIFQEVRLVINPFYWSLLPRDKTDELLQVNARVSATLEHSQKSSTVSIGIPDVKYINEVHGVVTEVMGLQAKAICNGGGATQGERDKKQDSRYEKGRESKDRYYKNKGFANSADQAVRPKVRPSNSVSKHNDTWGRDGVQPDMTMGDNPINKSGENFVSQRDASSNSRTHIIGQHSSNREPRSSNRMAANLDGQSRSTKSEAGYGNYQRSASQVEDDGEDSRGDYRNDQNSANGEDDDDDDNTADFRNYKRSTSEDDDDADHTSGDCGNYQRSARQVEDDGEDSRGNYGNDQNSANGEDDDDDDNTADSRNYKRSASQEDEYDKGRRVDYSNNKRSPNQQDNDGEASYEGPFSVAPLYYKYLEEKYKQDMDVICQKYGVKIEYIPDKKHGGQAYVMIKRSEKLARKYTLKEAADEFISLYQACFSRVSCKKIPCSGVRPKKIIEAKSIIWTEQSLVVVDNSIDQEVTFIGEEQDIKEAIKTFQRVIGQQPRSRRLKNHAGSTPSTSSNPDDIESASDGWKPIPNKSNDRCFQTNEGINVVARKDDITKQTVDVIVNAANSSLSHFSGVAGALSNAAGQELQDESDAIRRKQDSFPEGKCVHTKGYLLSCNYVIHAVGPSYDTYRYGQKKDDVFFIKLQETFSNCFSLAQKLGAKSVALPLVSSGNFGGPKDLCAKALVGAIRQYSSMEVTRSINDIYLVNKDDEACDAIVTALNWLKDGVQMDTSSGAELVQKKALWKEILPTSEHNSYQSYSSQPANTRHSVHSAFNAGDVQIVVEEQDILETATSVDSIIVPTDKMLQLNDGVAQDVANAAGSRLKKKCQDILDNRGGFSLNIGEIVHTHGFNLFHGAIIFVVAPNEKIQNSRQNVYDSIQDLVRKCLGYADKTLQVRSVALPLFPSDMQLKELFSEAFAVAVHQFTDLGPKNIRKIHITNADVESNMALQCAFQEEFKTVDSKPRSVHGAHAIFPETAFGRSEDVASHEVRPDRANSKGSDSSDKGGADKEEEDEKEDDSDEEDKHCPICFDDFSSDKPAVDLGKCKHKFCKECLDEAMRHKPVCPVCGVVYGVMKGNQPHGTMTVNESRYPGLPGYERCGTITIHYNFGSGTQGPNHPEPGRSYTGTSRTAYLPNNREGQQVLSLLRRAFDAKLTFTIGTSVTTGARNVVTWNDIHHKTSMSGGAQCFGYPDPTYLTRVTEELAAKGIK